MQQHGIPELSACVFRAQLRVEGRPLPSLPLRPCQSRGFGGNHSPRKLPFPGYGAKPRLPFLRFLSFSDNRTLFSAATGLYRKNLPLSAVSHINRRGQRRRKRNQNSIYVFLPKKGAFRSAASLRSEYLPHKPVACRYLAVTFGKSHFHFTKFFLSDPVLTDQAQKNF